MSYPVWPTMTDTQADEAVELWRTGVYDTRDIASMLFVRESEVANHLSRFRKPAGTRKEFRALSPLSPEHIPEYRAR